MANEFEKAIEAAKYSALPLPRTKSDPTSIFEFEDGYLTVVRNPHSCLPDPPISITEDPSVSMISFSHQFSFDLKGIVGFFTKIFRLGNAKAELEAKSVSKATVQLGGLSHHTIETGALIDYLIDKKPNTTCMRDILDKDHFTLVAALRAKSFTYEFSNSKGAVVKFSAPEVKGLFQADASVDIRVEADGKIVVTMPTYVGYIAWDGKRIAKEIEKAKAPVRVGITQKRPTTALRPFINASPSTIIAVENALTPDELYQRRLGSMNIRRVA